MKKNIIIILLTGFILSSFVKITPTYEPGEYSGQLFFYMTQKDAPEQGSRFVLDSVRGTATIDLTSGDIVEALKGKRGGIKPIKFFMIVTNSQSHKVLPITTPKSIIMYDFTGEDMDETMAFLKKNMKAKRDTLQVRVSPPSVFGGADMFFDLIREE